MVNPLDIMPVLALAFAIACIPILFDRLTALLNPRYGRAMRSGIAALRSGHEDATLRPGCSRETATHASPQSARNAAVRLMG